MVLNVFLYSSTTNKMKELLIRAASGLIYILALAGSALWNPFIFTAVLSIFFVFANLELLKLTGTKRINKYIFASFFYMAFILLSSVIIQLSIFFPFWDYPKYYDYVMNISFISSILLFLTIVILSLRNQANATEYLKSFSIHFIYLLIPFLFLVLLVFIDTVDFKYPYVILLFGIIWANDTFAYLGGKLLGKTPLASKISPKKTLEGLFSGVIFAVAIALVYNYFEPFANNIMLTIFVIFICAIGTIGDLFQSKLKREASVKDSGNLIPGHGGMLDRMDSILLTAPLFLFYLIILLF